ncbi:MAG: class I SAM-dependent methyltransferase, partial [Octadecabacter sp.]|nr:class I SAM-dependent methyltransferase [Octadecabacter sp.]
MWEDRFAAEDGYLFGVEPADVLATNPWLAMQGKSVLCLADGEGRNGVHLARLGMKVTSFDLSATAVSRANALAAQAGVEVSTHVSDWDSWDWSQQFDVVVAIFIQFAG